MKFDELTTLEKEILRFVIEEAIKNNNKIPYGFTSGYIYSSIGCADYTIEQIESALAELKIDGILDGCGDDAYIFTRETFLFLMKKFSNESIDKYIDKYKKIDERIINEIKSEFLRWIEFLNIGVGILSFSLGISCLGTDHPQLWAIISSVFIIIFLSYGKIHFPKKIIELREAKLETVDAFAFKGIEKEFLGINSLIKNMNVYFVGFIFLLGIAFGVVEKIPQWIVSVIPK